VAPVPTLVTSGVGLIGRALSRVDAHRFAGLNPVVLRSMQQPRYRSGARAASELGLEDGPLISSIEAAYRWFVDRGYC
jgi:hypothetical protein